MKPYAAYSQLDVQLQRFPQAYDAWRKLSRPVRAWAQPSVRALIGRWQLAAYEALAHQHGARVPYSEDLVRQKLAALAPERQVIRGEGINPLVVTMGSSRHWERFGLWQAFSQVARAEHVDLFARRTLPQRGVRARPRIARAMLEEVDKVAETQGPVAMVFLYYDSHTLSPALFEGLRARGIWSVVMGLDDKHRYAARQEYGVQVGQATLVGEADLLWTTWRTGAQRIHEQGGCGWYAPPGADPDFHAHTDGKRDIDVLFLGQCYGPRARLVQYLRQSGIDVYAAGQGWERGHVSFDESVQLYNRAKIVLGVSTTGFMHRVSCIKGRDFEVPMCGAVYLTGYNAELADFYTIGEEIACYASDVECAEVVHWLLQNPSKQAAMRRAVLARARREHTWARRIESMLSLFPSQAENGSAPKASRPV